MVLRSRGSEAVGQFQIDTILIKTTNKVNIRTENGYDMSPMQQTRTIPVAYQVSLPKNYDPAKKYPVILSVTAADPEPDHNTGIPKFVVDGREKNPDMPEFIIIAIHAINMMGLQPGTDINSEEFPYNSSDPAWYGAEILDYNKASVRPGETFPWSGTPANVGSSFDEQAYIETFQQIKADYNTEDKFYMDGASKTGNDIFTMVMSHPEYIAAAFGHEANYFGSGGTDIVDLGLGQIRPVSNSPDRVNVPVRLAEGSLAGEGNDMNFTHNIYNQYTNAIEGVPLPK
jgi:hypothetical protein